MPTHLNWSCDFSNIIIAELKETGALLCTTKNKNGAEGEHSEIKWSLSFNTHAKIFGEKEPLEGAVQTAKEMERR